MVPLTRLFSISPKFNSIAYPFVKDSCLAFSSLSSFQRKPTRAAAAALVETLRDFPASASGVVPPKLMVTLISPFRRVRVPPENVARWQMKSCPAIRPAAVESGTVQPFKFKDQFVSLDNGAIIGGSCFFAGAF